MLVKRVTAGSASTGNREMKNGNKTEKWKMKLLIGLGFKLGFVSFVFHFPVPRAARFPLFPFLV